jgi:hypothetical protein
VALLAVCVSCAREAEPVRGSAALGQWIWTRADLSRFEESAAARPGLEAGVFIGAIRCDAATSRLHATAGLSANEPRAAAVTVVIRFEDGLDRCRTPGDSRARFDHALDSAVHVLRERNADAPVREVQLDYDAPQRSLDAWATSVRHLAQHALRSDTVWVTSLVAHLRQPEYGDLFRGVVRGHVLQVFDTGEAATSATVREAIRLATRAQMPFRVGLGAFERDTRRGMTDHRAWFATVPRFAAVRGYEGLWVFPAGHRWISLIRERA